MNFLLFGAGANGEGGGTWPILIMIAVMGVFMFMSSRSQRKKQKEEQEMRNAVDIGDEITTIGGICGRVVTVKENTLIIETGADRNRMTITRWAIQSNDTARARVEAERAAAKEAAEKAKAEKKAGKSKKKDD